MFAIQILFQLLKRSNFSSCYVLDIGKSVDLALLNPDQDSDPACQVDTDRDPIRIQGFNDLI
jgi:hypothetical protein